MTVVPRQPRSLDRRPTSSELALLVPPAIQTSELILGKQDLRLRLFDNQFCTTSPCQIHWTIEFQNVIASHSMRDIDLIAAHWTIAGNATPGTDQEFSPFSFRDRVEHAAKVGFKGLTLWHADLAHVLHTTTLREIKKILDDNGMKYVELSVLIDWFLEPGELRSASDARRQFFLHIAETLNLWNFRVCDARRSPCPKNKLFEEFALLCKQAGERGTRITFEMAPFAMIDSLESALELVKGAGAKNGGILFDIWHIAKLGIPYDSVWRFPSEHFFGIEVNDGYITAPPTHDLMKETVSHRLHCGQGEFDVKRFLSYLPNSNYRGPVGVEVCSADLRSWSLERLAGEAYETTIAQFPD